MSAREEEVVQLSEEIDAVPDEPPQHQQFRELDIIPDTALYEDGERHTAFVDPNDLDKHLVVSHDVPVDLQEVR